MAKHGSDNVLSSDSESVESLFGLEEPDLSQEGFDKAENTEILNRSLPPKGTYKTNPEEFGELTKMYGAFTDDVGTRRVYTLSGRATGTFKEKEVTTFFRLKVSPDARKAQVFKDGKPTGEILDRDDSQTRRWAEAADAYEKTYHEPPKNKQAILDFLISQPFKLRLSPFNGEIFVQGIFPANGRR